MENRGINRCAAKMCTNNSKNSKYSLFKFPVEKNKSNVWAMACNREDLISKVNLNNLSYRLCEMHFEEKMFANNSHNRLKRNAIPTLFTFRDNTASTSNMLLFVQDDNLTNKKLNILQNIVLSPPIKENKLISSEISPSFKSVLLAVAETQTTADLSASTPRKQKLKRKMKCLESANANLVKKARIIE